MIIELTDTTSAAVATRLVHVREEGGVVALGRVLTLIVLASGEAAIEEAIVTTNQASREHPARVIVVDTGNGHATDGLDAEIRVGADAGASEVVLLRPRGAAAWDLDTLLTPLLLPDTPIVAYWVGSAPESPAKDAVGRMAQRRITDVTDGHDPCGQLASLAENYTPGDTDLAWARITLWRALLASVLDGITGRVREIVVQGDLDRPSTYLLAGWLRSSLGVPVATADSDAGHVESITVTLDDGEIVIDRPAGATAATISRTGARDQLTNLPLRPMEDCLMEDLRRLDSDPIYTRALAAAQP